MPNTRRYRPGFLRRSVLFSIPASLAICLAVIAVSLFGRVFGDTAAGIQTASTLCLTAVGLWVLNVALRPLSVPRIILISSMYVLLALVLLVPISQQYHLFAMPSAELLAVSFVAAVLGSGLVELGWRLYAARVEAPSASPSTRG